MSSFSDERQEARKQIQINVGSLINNRRDRMRNMHKMSEGDLNEQAKTTRSLINQFPLVRYEKLGTTTHSS